MTPAYVPPETIPGLIDATGAERARFSQSMDVYAFGLTLYQILTGRIPYSHLKPVPDMGDLKSVAQTKREERDGAHRPISRAALDEIDWSDCALEQAATAADRAAFVEELWQFLARVTHVDAAQRGRASDVRGALAKLILVRDVPLEAAAMARDSQGDDPRCVRPWFQDRLRLDTFASRLADAGRDPGSAKDSSRLKIRRGGGDFWEMQGFAPR
jgi:serine/threonine protein kinase